MNVRTHLGAVVCASLIGFTATMFGAAPALLPLAAAEESASTHRSVSAGTMQWGVRESFRKYIEGPIAHGSISVGGGAQRSGDGFTFDAKSSALTSASDGEISFQGEVHFTGHNDALDMTLRNPTVVVNGTQAELRVDYASRKYEGMNSTGPVREGTQELLATIALNAAPDFSAQTTTIAGPTSLTTTGAEIFGGFYEVGAPLDPVTSELSLNDASGPAPQPKEGGGTSGAKRSGATSGPARLLGEINDTLEELNAMFANTETLLHSGESLHRRVLPTQEGTSPAPAANSGAPTSNASRTGGTSNATNSPANVNPGSVPATPAGAPKVSGGTNTGNAAKPTGAAPAGGASDSGICDSSASRGIVSSEAQWGIRQSFRTYIRGNIAKGRWELKGVGDDGNAFTFSGNSGAVDTAARSGSILYPGTIHFTGHEGVLDTRFSNMEIQFSGDSGQIVINVSSNSTDGKGNDFGRIAIANLSFSELSVSDSAVSGSAQATLTQVGAEAFGQFYPAGAPLDPVSFSARLGNTANCREGQGGASSESSTGKGGTAGDAAALKRGGTAGAQAKLNSGTTPENAKGSVFDEVEGTDAVESAKQPEGGKFQIKNSAAGDGAGSGGWDDSTVAKLLLLVASLLGAGGALTRFIATG